METTKVYSVTYCTLIDDLEPIYVETLMVTTSKEKAQELLGKEKQRILDEDFKGYDHNNLFIRHKSDSVEVEDNFSGRYCIVKIDEKNLE